MKVLYFFRKKSPEFNSIEMLFSGLIDIVRKVFESYILDVPSASAELPGSIENILFEMKRRGQLVRFTSRVN